MRNERIVFNVDLGVNISEKEVEKELSKNWDVIQKDLEKGKKPLKIKINPETAIDDKGNPIDKATLANFEKKAEKQINQVLNQIMKSFGSEMTDKMSATISDKVTTEVKAVFANMSSAIIDSINDMQNDILSSIQNMENNITSAMGGKQTKIDTSKMVNIDTRGAVDKFEQGSKDVKKASEKFISDYQKALVNLEEAKKDLNKVKKSKKYNPDIEIDGEIFNDEKIEKLKQNSSKMDSTLKELSLKFKEAYDKYLNIDDEDNSSNTQELMSKLEKRQKDLATVIMKFDNENMDLLKKSKFFGEDGSDYILGISDFADGASKAIIKNAKKEVAEAQAVVDQLRNDPKFKVLGIDESSLNLNKSGIETKINVEPTINPNKFINKVYNAVKSITDNIKPVEIPIKPNAESIGEFVANVADSLSEGLQKYPTRLVLDTEDFVSQIKQATEGINVNINGNLSGVTVSGTTTASNNSDIFDDDEYWDALMSESNNNVQSEIPTDFMEQLTAQMQAASKESNELEEEIEDVNIGLKDTNTNLDNTAQKIGTVKQSAKEIVDILTNSKGNEDYLFVDENEISELTQLKEVIRAYDEVLKDLRYKKGIPRTDVNKLEKKKNRTSEEDETLQKLKEEHAARQKIYDEWQALLPVIERANNAQDIYNENAEKLQKLEELRNEKSNRYLQPTEQRKLDQLSKEEKQIKKNLDVSQRELEVAQQALEIEKQKSEYFGTYSVGGLQKIALGVTSKDSISKLKKSAATAYENKLTKEPVGSAQYNKEYEKALNNQNGLFKKHLNSLTKEADKWNDIINLVDKYGSKSNAIEQIQKEIDKVNRQLDNNTKGQIIAEEKFKNGVYTSQKMSEITDAAKKEKKELQQQKSLLISKSKSLKKASEEELELEVKRNNQRQELLQAGKVQEAEIYKSRYEIAVDTFKKEISTEEGRNKEFNRLRYEDLSSYKRYLDEYNALKEREQTKKSYDKQLQEEKDRLISEGMPEEKANKEKFNILKDKKAYFQNEDLIKKYNAEFQAIDLNLNEIIRLMQEIDELQDKLADGQISSDEVSSVKSQLNTKKSNLEVLVERTGWSSGDILGYQQFKQLTDKHQKSSFDVVKKSLNLDKFKKDATSVQDVVDNIQTELTQTEKENKTLIEEVNKLEAVVNRARENITVKHQNDADTALQRLNEIKTEKEQLTKEIDKLNDGEEKTQKQQRLGTLNYWEKSATKKYNDALDPSKVQVKIDSELAKVTRNVQEQIVTKKNQILTNEDYINSLKKELEVQKEKRKIEEPTKNELELEKKSLTSEKSNAAKKYNNEIKESKEHIIELENQLNEAVKTSSSRIQNIDKEIEELNKKLEEAKKKLNDLKEGKIQKNFNQTNTDSDLYKEYQEKNISYNTKYSNATQTIDKLSKENELLQSELLTMSKKYGMTDKNASKFDLYSELEKYSKVAKMKKLIEHLQLIQPAVNGGIQPAIEDSKKSIKELVDLSEQVGVKFNTVEECSKNVDQILGNLSLDNVLKDIDDFWAKTNKFEENTKILNSTKLPDQNIASVNRKEYVSKLYSAFEEEQRKYNEELAKSGELTEEAEEHLLNMQRYMNEYNRVSLKSERKSFNIDEKTTENMKWAWKDAKDAILNVGDSVDIVEEKIKKAEEEVNNIENEIREKESSKNFSSVEDKLKRQISLEEQKIAQLEKQKKEETDLISLKQKQIKEQLKEIDKPKVETQTDNSKIDETTASIKEETTAIKELENVSEQTAQSQVENQNTIQKEIDETVQKVKEYSLAQINKNIKNAKKDTTKEKWQNIAIANGYSIGENGLAEEQKQAQVEIEKTTDALIEQNQIVDSTSTVNNAESNPIVEQQNKAQEEIGQTNDALIEQKNIAQSSTTATQPNVVEKQQEEAQKEIKQTNTMLEEQISNAIHNAQVSIADGSYVNIAGDVHIDDAQWSGIDRLTESSENLLTVVQNIYSTIATGSVKAVSDINQVKAPIENITNQVQEVDNALNGTNVKLKSFGNNIKAVSAGNININSKEFKDIQVAISDMNEALKDNATFKKIASSGDITAKYFSKIEKDEDGEKIAKPFLKLNTVFKDTNGQIIKVAYEYDILGKKITDVTDITAKVSDKFTQQEQSMKDADQQLKYYTSQLDKLLLKYKIFDIEDFGVDDTGKLFANVGTRAERIYSVIRGNTKDAIKDAVLYKNEVENAFIELKSKAENGLFTEDTFKEATANFNEMVAIFESKLNTVNRNMNTATEKNARSLLEKWQNELYSQYSWLYNGDGSIRKDTSILNSTGLDYIEKYKQALSELQSMYKEFVKQGEYFTESQVLQWKEQMQTISDLKKDIYSNISKKYVNGKGYSLDGLSIDSKVFERMANDSSYAKQILSSLAEEISQTDIEVIKLSSDNKTLTYSFKDVDKNVQTCKLTVDDYGQTIRNTVVNSSSHVGLLSRAFGSLKDKLIQITKYVSAYEIFYKVVNAVKSGIEIVKELDTAMTEMKKVTKDSEQALEDFSKASHKIAQEIGSTASTIQNSAADWMGEILVPLYGNI